MKTLTILIGVSIISILLGELYIACSTGARDCSAKKFPTISSTIITYEEFNRIFLLFVTLFTYGVVSSIVRSFYKMLNGVISVGTNNTYMVFGYLVVVTLPMIGIFDTDTFSTIHGTFAVLFFGSTSIYFTLIGRALYFHKDKYPASKQKAIETTMNATKGLYITLIALLLSFLLPYNGYMAICEWATGLYYLIFFPLIMYTNSFLETVHDSSDLGKLLPNP